MSPVAVGNETIPILVFSQMSVEFEVMRRRSLGQPSVRLPNGRYVVAGEPYTTQERLVSIEM